MPDSLSDRYAELLTGSYDCVDRIVLNAFFRMGHAPGGFRVWWQALTGSEETLWCAELHRLRGVFLTVIGADEMQIEASFCEAIRIAKEQKSVSLAKRAEATYAEYRRQKASGSGGRGFRLPLW